MLFFFKQQARSTHLRKKNAKKRDLAYLFVKKENLILRANICDVQNNQKLEILEKFSKPSRYAYGYE